MHDRALSFLIQTLMLVVVYWIFSQVLQGQNLNRLITAIILGAVVNGIIFLLAFTEGVPQLTLQGFAYGLMRPKVMDVHANAWPFPSMIGLVMLMSVVVHGTVRHRDWFWMVPAGMLLAGVAILNMSRSILLGILVSTIFIFSTHPRARKLMIGMLLFLGFISLIALPSVQPKIEMLLRLRSGLTGREEIWPMAWKIIEDHPIFGIGPANFKECMFFEAPFMSNSLRRIIAKPTAHNAYLHIGAEIGLVGSLVVLSLLSFFTLRSRKLWLKLKDTPHFPILVAISAMMVAGFARSLVETEVVIQHGFMGKNLLVIALLAFQDQLSARSFPNS